jgi:hypothetical protein
MHAGNEFGKRAGFKGAILQGLGTWNIAIHGVLMEMGDSDPLKVPLFQGQICQCRLPQYIFQTRTKCLCGADLKPGDCLETRIWKVGTKDGMGDHLPGNRPVGPMGSTVGGGPCLPPSQQSLANVAQQSNRPHREK